ncbi:hypothetical protein [Natronospora cellulosivora (SeqCode)]
MTYPTIEEEIKPNPNYYNPYTLFLILILLILSTNTLQILKSILKKYKANTNIKNKNTKIDKKNRALRTLPAKDNYERKKFKEDLEKKKNYQGG